MTDFLHELSQCEARLYEAEQRCVLLTKQRDVLETALLKIAYEGHKVTWARAVARDALDASFLLARKEAA
jgi:hypothetical protein